MTTAYDVPAEKLIKLAAQKLRETDKIKSPDWAQFVKTGANKELPPDDPDWWFTRCASLLRRVYIDGPVGVSRVRSFYGGSHRNGVAPHHFARGSGSIVRKAMQQLEKEGFLKSAKSGRVITPQGQAFLDNIANEIKKEIVSKQPDLAKY